MIYNASKNLEGREMRNLKDIAQIQVGFTLARAKASPSSSETYSYKMFSINAFPIDGIQMIHGYENPYLSSEKISKNYITHKGDVVIRLREPIKSLFITKDEEGLLVSSLAVIVRVDENEILGEYLAYYLNSTLSQNYFQTKVRGTAIPMIRVADLKEMPIPTPSLSRQRQIVALMRESDRQTSLLSELIKQKTRLKQQFFKSLIKE